MVRWVPNLLPNREAGRVHWKDAPELPLTILRWGAKWDRLDQATGCPRDDGMGRSRCSPRLWRPSLITGSWRTSTFGQFKERDL